MAVIGLGAVWGCADGRNQLSPVSPSTLSSSPSPAARGVSRTPFQRVDNDGDGYDDPEPPGDAPPPVPDPGQIPPAVQLTVNITSSFGTGAFAPNPLQAATGNTIVWLNADLINHDIMLDDGTPVGNLAPGRIQPSAGSRRPGDLSYARVASDGGGTGHDSAASPVDGQHHRLIRNRRVCSENPLQAATGNTIVWLNANTITHAIVLDDGTPVGNLAPGQSSPPLALANPVTGYHCTLHPTMVGQITMAPREQPPDPGYVPPPTDPPDDGPGYDWYYLKKK